MEKRRWAKQKISALIIVGVLLICTAYSALAGNNSESGKNEKAVVPQEEKEAEKETVKEYRSALTGDKQETVYVKAGADGSVQEITVDAVLKNPGTGEDISDFSTLQNIKNTEGDEEYTSRGGGYITWENHGEDISYTGTGAEDLPVSVKVRYFLDGKELRAEEIAGKSGAVKIRFEYENHTLERVEIDGVETEVSVPFAAVPIVFLPQDTFSNVEVTNGKAIAADGQSIVIGSAYPGLGDSLQLDKYEPTKDVSPDDFVEITADVTEFELPFTASVIANGIFGELDLEKLEDANDLKESMDEFNDASGKLSDAIADLLDGVKELHLGMKTYTDGVGKVNDGAKGLSDALHVLNKNKAGLESGAAAIESGLTGLNQALLCVALPDADDWNQAAVTDAMTALVADAEVLSEALAAVQGSLEAVQGFAENAASYAESVEKMRQSVQEELDAAEMENLEEELKTQAGAAAEEALRENEKLTEEEKQQICKQVEASVNTAAAAASKEHIAGAKVLLGDLPSLEIPKLSLDTGDLSAVATDMQKQLEILSGFAQGLSGMSEQFETMERALNSLKSGVEQLKNGSTQLRGGIAAFNQGIEQLVQGADALSAGTDQLDSAGGALNQGMDALVEGVSKLKEGFETFDEEGIQKLTDLAGDDLQNVIRRVKALKEADRRYENYSGIEEGKKGSVKFIIETEEIEME